MSKNPIIRELLLHIQNGKQVQVISPEKNCSPNKKVTFYFGDNTNAVLTTESDHNTFMVWWGEFVNFHQMSQKMVLD